MEQQAKAKADEAAAVTASHQARQNKNSLFVQAVCV